MLYNQNRRDFRRQTLQ
ncbi:MAG: hypothetical protein ACI4LO_02630, partial [Anaerovoracaceae bacterium]